MVLMALLGGKGTLWGPVLGAALFHIIKEVTWTYLLGWQWVTLGALIIVNVIFFQQGILGWAMEKWPRFFGVVVDEDTEAKTGTDAKSTPVPAAPVP
jgi:branched-chain amino acid transport system permease protein